MSRRLLTCSWKGESIISEALLAPLAAWQNYYVIVGTAAATLTGLMFMVITLMAQLNECGGSVAKNEEEEHELHVPRSCGLR